MIEDLEKLFLSWYNIFSVDDQMNFENFISFYNMSMKLI